MGVGAHGKEVVLANENDRQFVQAGHVECFVKRADVDRAVTHVAKRDAVLATIFAGEGEARSRAEGAGR